MTSPFGEWGCRSLVPRAHVSTPQRSSLQNLLREQAHRRTRGPRGTRDSAAPCSPSAPRRSHSRGGSREANAAPHELCGTAGPPSRTKACRRAAIAASLRHERRHQVLPGLKLQTKGCESRGHLEGRARHRRHADAGQSGPIRRRGQRTPRLLETQGEPIPGALRDPRIPQGMTCHQKIDRRSSRPRSSID